jgi:hypothetical protein
VGSEKAEGLASARKDIQRTRLIRRTTSFNRRHPLAMLEALDLPDVAIGAIGAAAIAFTGVALGWGFTAWQNRVERRANQAAALRSDRLAVYLRFLASFEALDRLTREIQYEDGDRLREGLVANEDYQNFMQCASEVLLVTSDETAERVRRFRDAVNASAMSRAQRFFDKRDAAKAEAAGESERAKQLRARASELSREADELTSSGRLWYQHTFHSMRADLNGTTPPDVDSESERALTASQAASEELEERSQ